jgi:putative ABC transport system ATP-binding protein
MPETILPDTAPAAGASTTDTPRSTASPFSIDATGPADTFVPAMNDAAVLPQSGVIAIEAAALTKRVADATGELTILRDVSFSVPSGATVAIVGASGSGKSTLLGLLAGLDTPSAGTVKINGTDIFALDEDGRAALRMRELGFVFQSFQLLAHLSALENVMLPLELRGDRLAAKKAGDMLARVGLSSRLRHYPKYLSGGEQQRVALARAFVSEPPLLFADEPTGSLDAATGDAVIELMFELNQERKSTLVLVTHDPAMAALCARTITIAAGQLV